MDLLANALGLGLINPIQPTPLWYNYDILYGRYTYPTGDRHVRQDIYILYIRSTYWMGDVDTRREIYISDRGYMYWTGDIDIRQEAYISEGRENVYTHQTGDSIFSVLYPNLLAQ